MLNNLEDLTFIKSVWDDADTIDPATLAMIFESAFEVVIAYAPFIKGPVPTSYFLAEIMQARHIWTQFSGGNRDEMGSDGLSIPTYPLVFAARDLIRPKRNPLSRLGR